MITIDSLADLAFGRRDRIPVCSVEGHIADAIGAKTHVVTLSKYTLHHVLEEHHDVKSEHFLMLPNMIENGLVVHERDRGRGATVCYQNEKDGRRYITAIKATRDGKAIFAETLHRSRKRQTKSILARGKVLRTHRITFW